MMEELDVEKHPWSKDNKDVDCIWVQRTIIRLSPRRSHTALVRGLSGMHGRIGRLVLTEQHKLQSGKQASEKSLLGLI